MKSTPDRAAKMMGHILAMNKNPTVGLKNGNQPPRGISKVTAFAKGGKVQAFAKGGAVKAAKPKMEMKMAKKGCKFAAGGAAKTRRSSPKPKPIKKVPYVNGG